MKTILEDGALEGDNNAAERYMTLELQERIQV